MIPRPTNFSRSIMARWICSLVLLCPLSITLGQEKNSVVSLRVAKYPDLGVEILKHRGKVVLVDFWAEY